MNFGKNTESELRARLSLDRDEQQGLKWLALDGRSYYPRISLALAARMLTTCQSIGDRQHIVNELDVLEGLRKCSKAKREAPFKHPPLRGLFKKHYCSHRHVLANIGLRWGLAHRGNEDLDALIRTVAKEAGSDPSRWPAVLERRLHEGYLERAVASRMTGDWIIFGKHEGQNFYLDIACHQEAAPDKAHSLLRKLQMGCAAEFPFFFESIP